VFKRFAVLLLVMALVGGFSGISFADTRSVCLPTAQFDWWTTENQPKTIQFDASCSQGEIIEYRWSFGGGRWNWAVTPKPRISHEYWSPGSYSVTLRVMDKSGATDSVTQMVIVIRPSPRPVARFNWNVIGEWQKFQTIRFDASYSHPQGELIQWEWNFGDGKSQTTIHPYISHDYDLPGRYYVTLKVIDMRGWTDSVTQMVVVPSVPRPPEVTETVIRAHIDPLEGLARIISSVLLLVAFKAFLW